MARSATAARRTFQLRYRHKIHEPGVRERITSLALNGSGIRDTARVLGISTQAVMAELKKNRCRKPASARAPGLRAGPGRRPTAMCRRDVVVCGPQKAAPLALVGGRSGQRPRAGLRVRPAHARHLAAVAAGAGRARVSGGALVYRRLVDLRRRVGSD